MISKVKFDEVASPIMTDEKAYEAVRAGYSAVRNAAPENKVEKAKELFLSPAMEQMMNVQPWFAVDIAYAILEAIPQNLREKDNNFAVVSQKAGQFTGHYLNIYPQAALYYREKMGKLLSGEVGQQDPVRQAWQNARRPMLDVIKAMEEKGTDATTLDTLKLTAMETLAVNPFLLKQIPDAPWSVLDVYKVLTDAVAETDKFSFAQKYLLGSEAFKAVEKDFPRLATFYQDWANSLPKASVTPDAHPSPAP